MAARSLLQGLAKSRPLVARSSNMRLLPALQQQQQQQCNKSTYRPTPGIKPYVTERDRFWLRMTGVMKCPAHEIPNELPDSVITKAYSRLKLFNWGFWATVILIMCLHAKHMGMKERKRHLKELAEESPYPR